MTSAREHSPPDAVRPCHGKREVGSVSQPVEHGELVWLEGNEGIIIDLDEDEECKAEGADPGELDEPEGRETGQEDRQQPGVDRLRERFGVGEHPVPFEPGEGGGPVRVDQARKCLRRLRGHRRHSKWTVRSCHAHVCTRHDFFLSHVSQIANPKRRKITTNNDQSKMNRSEMC